MYNTEETTREAEQVGYEEAKKKCIKTFELSDLNKEGQYLHSEYSKVSEYISGHLYSLICSFSKEEKKLKEDANEKEIYKLHQDLKIILLGLYNERISNIKLNYLDEYAKKLVYVRIIRRIDNYITKNFPINIEKEFVESTNDIVKRVIPYCFKITLEKCIEIFPKVIKEVLEETLKIEPTIKIITSKEIHKMMCDTTK